MWTEADKKDPYAAPLVAENLTNLPPAFVIAAEFDVLRDEALAYAEKLKVAGVKVESTLEEGLVHGYFTNMAVFPEQIRETIAKIDQFLNANIVRNV